MKRTLVLLSMVTGAAAGAADAPQPSKELVAKGQATYGTYCSSCHGEKGAGDGAAAVALNPKPRHFSKDAFKQGEKPAEVFQTVSAGVPGTSMVGYAHLPEEDRWGLAYYVLQLRHPGKDVAAAADAKPDPKIAPAKAKKAK